MNCKKFLLQLMFLTCLLSCTERIEIETRESFARLVVDGFICTDTMPQTVILSSTSDYFSNQPAPAVTGASVTISDGIVKFLLTESSPGIYRTDPSVFGVAGHQYRLDIKLATPVGGHSEYSATSTLCPSVILDSIQLKFHPRFFTDSVWEVKGYLQDSPVKDYYRFLISRNGKMLSDSLSDWLVTDDRFFNGNYVNGVTIAYLQQHRPDETLKAGDRIIAEMDVIEKDYADFIWNAQSELLGSNPLFSGPPANIQGNINNGAFGFFASYSISRAIIVMPEFK